jgi:transcriptional regulator with XRE-family HTH domain/tetratricopeptide (TPR) repeat protein
MSGQASGPWYERPEARAALGERDVCAVYRLLQREGVSQREIARRTGQSQSEVSDIVAGRAVRDVRVLERICDGLSVPRELMRLSGGAAIAYAEEVSADEVSVGAGEVDETRRRDLIARAGIAVVGCPVNKLGQLIGLPGPAPVRLPARVEGVHVAQVRNLTRRLGAASNAGTDNAGTDPEVLSAIAAWAQRLLSVPGAEPVRRALMVAVAELHMEAAWAGFDAWRYDQAAHHFSTALSLATEAKDVYLQAEALAQAGLVTREFGHPNDGLKLLQFGQVKALDILDDEPRAVVVGSVGRAAVQACARVDAATALADLGNLDAAEVEMAEARELWSATRADAFGDLDRPAARLALRRGRLDAAEALAADSVRRWEGVNYRGQANSSILLATVHVRAGEPSGLSLAHNAITMVGKLSSVRLRRQLQPLAAALRACPRRDAQDLARMAHTLTTTA